MTGPTCGLPACSSPCHDAAVTTGRYCAPARCYCGGCPAFVAVDRPGPVTVEQLAERRRQAVDDARRQLAAAHFRHDLAERVADSYAVEAAAGGLVAA